MTATETAILPVLAELGLQRIVQVDDANVEKVDFNHVWESCSVLSEVQWQILGVALDGRPPEDWRGAVEGHWNSLDTAGQKSFAGGALAACGRLDAEKQDADTRFQAALRKVFPGTALRSMSLDEWRSNGAGLIDEAKTTPTLFLFDLHFERENARERQGVQLLKENKDHDHVVLGILSHDPSLEDEPAAWAAISEEAQVAPARFVVLSKKRMTTDDPSLLLDGFRRTVLVRVVEQVKQTCQAILDPSIQLAKKAINDINVYDFDQAIFRSSRIEGVWEGDTYFRLFNATVRRHAQKAMHGSAELRGQITQIRERFPIKEVVDPSVERGAWRLHRRELYEDPEFVNNHCLPISNGDVFGVAGQNGGKDRIMVLVGQPCDLVVRLKGKRVFDDELSRMGFWLEATALPAGEHTRPSEFELPYFQEGARVSWRLNLGRIHYVCLAALDLCALNVDGTAKLPLDKDVDQPLLLPGWRARVKLLQKAWKKPLAALPKVKLEEPARNALIAGLLPRPCYSVNVAVGLYGAETDRTLTLGIERVGRIAPELSAALLGRVAAHMSRPAFEHDLARERNSAE